MKYTLLSLIATAGAAHAAVTLGFSTAANVSGGWANSAGLQNVPMAWGIIVDVAGDGFNGFAGLPSTIVDGGTLLSGVSTYDAGFFRTGTSGAGARPGGQVLSVGGVATDDIIFFSSNLMAVVAGQARATQLAAMSYAAGMQAGTKYGIIWFEATTLGNTEVGMGDQFGFWYKEGAAANAATILPADPGNYTAATNGPAGMWGAAGTAGTKSAQMTLVPETSVSLLGALGAFSLLRRRR